MNKDDEPLLIKIVAWIVLGLLLFALFKMYKKTEQVEIKNFSMNDEIHRIIRGYFDVPEKITFKVGQSEYDKKLAMDTEASARDVIAREIDRRQEIIDMPVPKSDVMHYAMLRCEEEFGIDNWSSLFQLIDRESGWDMYAINQSSGACGLGQAYPCMKMGCELSDMKGQIDWLFGYIINRYGNPNNAWNFWLNHNYY